MKQKNSNQLSNFELTLHNWRQFEHFKLCLDFDQSFMLLDDNGKGKSSILSAVYSIFTGLAFPSTKFTQSLKQNQQYFGLSTQDSSWHLAGQINSYGKLVTKFQPPTSQKQRLITYQTKDNYWLLETREQKLKELDNLLIQIDPNQYPKTLREYNKFLRAKQNLIRYCQLNNNTDYSLLMNLNDNILRLSQIIWNKRRDFFEFLDSSLELLNIWLELDFKNKIFFRHEISNNKGVRQLFTNVNHLEIVQIHELWQSELLSGQVLFGAHRDNFQIMINHHPVETFLSSGQLRILTILIKVLSSQFNPQEGVQNWFIFDDVFEEIDSQRQKIVFEQILNQADYYILGGSKKPNIRDLQTKNLEQIMIE